MTLFQVFDEPVLLLSTSSSCLLPNAFLIYVFTFANSKLELKMFMLLFLKYNEG